MPTGYTAGILDGKTTTFQQFATQCMRAMGATIHMRDEPFDAPYQDRVPGSYYSDRIQEAKDLLQKAKNLSDEEIISLRQEEIRKSKVYHLEQIEKAAEGKNALEKILSDVREWVPPTKDHKGLKEFMIDQIVKTIDFDCNPKYHYEALEKMDENIDPNYIRNEIIAQANKDLEYNTKNLADEVKRCEDSNRWVKQLIESLNTPN